MGKKVSNTKFCKLWKCNDLEKLIQYSNLRSDKKATFSEDMLELFNETLPDLAKVLDVKSNEDQSHILIMGETGTGKELVVDKIEELQKKDIARINCAAISPTLIESEFFGHKKGSFSDAKENRAGLLKETNGSVIFLDEFAELENYMQAKLLRAIQFGEIRSVGSDETVHINIRVIAATNKPEKLREDIIWRFLDTIELPPLRNRREDIIAYLLKQELKEKFKWLFRYDVIVSLLFSHFAGNFRELINATILSKRKGTIKYRDEEYIEFEYHPTTKSKPHLVFDKNAENIWQNLIEFTRTIKLGKKWFPESVINIHPILFRHGNEFEDYKYFELEEIINLLSIWGHLFQLKNGGNQFLFYNDFVNAINNLEHIVEIPPQYIHDAELLNENNQINENLSQKSNQKNPQVPKTIDTLFSLKFKDYQREYFKHLRNKYATQVEAAIEAGMSGSTFSANLKKHKLPPYRKKRNTE